MNPFTLFYKKIEQLYDKKISSSGLAIFRITWGLVLFFEVREMYIFRDLRFNTIPFIDFYELSFGPIIFVWMILVLLLILGYKTKYVIIMNYILSLLFFGNIHSFEYHAFHAYIGINFILLFLPVSNSFSLDNLVEKIKFTRVNYLHKTKNKVSVIYYYIPIIVGIGFVYLDSILFKMGSSTWLSGLGVWRPSVLPNFNISGDLFFLNNEFLVKTMGYTTVAFELIFIFIFFIKKLRWPIFIIGMGLHFGILIVFPIPLFALLVCSIYFLMVPVGTWSWIKNKLKTKEPKITFIYDSECPLCTKTRVLIENLDFFNRIAFESAQTAKSQFKELKNIEQAELITHIYSVSKKGKIYKGVDTYIQVLFHTLLFSPIALMISLPGIKHIGKLIYSYLANNREREICDENHCLVYSAPEDIDENKSVIKGLSLKKIKIFKLIFLISFLTILQINVSISSGIVYKGLAKSGIWNSSLGSKLKHSHFRLIDLSTRFLGLTQHPVFMDGHYIEYNNIFAVTYLNKNNEVIWLPIIDKNGHPGRYLYGANWVNWTFRVNCTYYDEEKLRAGLIRYTSFWAGKEGEDLNNLSLNIKLKKVKTTEKFQKQFLTNQSHSNDWIDFGTINWINKKAEIELYYKPVHEGLNDLIKK